MFAGAGYVYATFGTVATLYWITAAKVRRPGLRFAAPLGFGFVVWFRVKSYRVYLHPALLGRPGVVEGEASARGVFWKVGRS